MRALGGDGMDALEIGLLAGLAPLRGFAVASTDYEGLGGPGVHPYLVGISEGRSMLDAGLAARQLPGVAIGSTAHVEAAVPSYTQGLDWLVGLVEGVEPLSSCADG